MSWLLLNENCRIFCKPRIVVGICPVNSLSARPKSIKLLKLPISSGMRPLFHSQQLKIPLENSKAVQRCSEERHSEDYHPLIKFSNACSLLEKWRSSTLHIHKDLVVKYLLVIYLGVKKFWTFYTRELRRARNGACINSIEIISMKAKNLKIS